MIAACWGLTVPFEVELSCQNMRLSPPMQGPLVAAQRGPDMTTGLLCVCVSQRDRSTAAAQRAQGHFPVSVSGSRTRGIDHPLNHGAPGQDDSSETPTEKNRGAGEEAGPA